MKKILVPVDFSGHTELTCDYALDIAKISGAELLLFHTYFDQIIIADSSFPDTLNMSTIYNEELLKEVFHQAEKKIADLKIRIETQINKEKITNVTVKTSLAGGEIEPELRLVCKDYQPDLIIMGSTGKGKTLNIWGKVSTFIIDHAHVPVFIIPESAKRKPLHNIMLAADLSDNNEIVIRKLLESLRNYDIKIWCTHFIQKEKSGEEVTKMDSLRTIFSKDVKKGILSFHLADPGDDNQAAINQFITQNNIDLVAFQPHKHGFFYLLFTKNITKKNLFATNMPLLAIPVKE